ncbi:hypothetical protein JYT74_02335 [Crocinitomix catalasitica]|nr:hypothetical protein [Crocinitomix catalasitica]
MPENFASYKEKIEAKFTATYLLIKAVVGFIFFEWTVFEMAVVFLLETGAIYLVHEFDRYFINKKTRIPVFFSLIQLAFSVGFLCGLMWGYAIVAFLLSGRGVLGSEQFGKSFRDV